MSVFAEARRWLGFLSIVIALGCRSTRDGTVGSGVASTVEGNGAVEQSGPALQQTHPAVGQPTELLWVEHILIRYSGAHPSVPFGPPAWRFASTPTRSKSEARQLASALAEQARQRPDRFSELAQSQSDDDFTRDLGGKLGGLPPAQFRPWPEVLATLTGMRSGHISDVVETRAGFHVLHRVLPPRPDTLSGSRIVIGYDEASWLWTYVARPGRAPQQRTRQQAGVLARSVYELASKDPAQFSRLVDEYSEHRDALRDGDLGQWSTEEVSSHPRELVILQRIEIGQVHPPVDSLIGFQIILRTPNDGRRMP